MAQPGNPARFREAKQEVTTISADPKQEVVSTATAYEDEAVLAALGYKQEFKRDFSIWSSFSVAFSILGLLPSIASTFSYDLGTVGLAGSTWSYLLALFFIQFIGLSMAELCSSMPTAGGLYYASAVLAPDGWGPLMAWITGWSNFLGWIAAACSINYALALMILAAAQITKPSFAPQNWHIYLVLLLLLGLGGLLTMNTTRFVAKLNILGTFINLVALMIFCIWLPLGSQHPINSNATVWGASGFTNGTEWPTGFSFLLSFLTAAYTVSGYDAPFHLSEECSNANLAGPRAIIGTTLLGFALGWPIIIAVAYTIVDVQEVVAGPYGQPLASLCLQVLGKKPALVLFSINMVAQFFCAQGVVTAASRVIFAYSRDGALPGSRWLCRVNKRTRTPVNAIWFLIAGAVAVSTLLFASPIAIGAVFSCFAIAQNIAYSIPIALKLFFGGKRFKPGPFNLGKFSRPCNAIALCYVAVIVPVLCFPSVKGADLNRLNMNYASLMYGGCMTLSLLWYAVDAHKWFKGPRVNMEHLPGTLKYDVA